MSGPLSHIRVLDLSRVLAGPWCGQNLADLGAEVIKVERPKTGDDSRAYGPPWMKDASGKETSEAAYFMAANRGKKSITVNLNNPEGQKLVRDLAAKCDVLVENYRPGALEKLGLGPDQLRAINPKLVYVSVSGYGQTGPYRRRSGFAHIAHGFAGLSYLAGFPNETPVVPGTAPLGDYLSSLYGAIGILIALRHREQTGEGQIIDIGIYEAVFRQMDEIAAAYGLLGKVRQREGAGAGLQEFTTMHKTRRVRWRQST